MNRRSMLTLAAAGGAALAAGAPAMARPARLRPVSPSVVQARDGTGLFVRDWGDGAPVVLVHGWALASDMWARQMPPLCEQGWRCIAYDRRGHGRSADPGRGYDYDTLADDLAAVLERLDLRGVTLVGHSMAAGELARYLPRHGGGRVARLVFVSPACTPYLAKAADNPAGIDPAVFEAVRREKLARDFPKWLQDNSGPFFTPDTSPETIAWVGEMMRRTSMKAVMDCHRAMTSTDFRADLRAIARPTLVIHGDKDASAPLAMTGAPTAAMIPGARLVVYPGAPHGLFVTHAERLAQDIAGFTA